MQPHSPPASTLHHAERPTPGWLKTAFWLCIFISVAVVLRRVIALASPPSSSAPPQLAGLDAAFASHTTLTLAHILPALLFVALIPLAFLRRTRDWKWPERILFPLGTIVGLTAYAMSRYSIGGWVERSAVLVFNSAFLFSLFRAWFYRHTGDLERKRIWLTRAAAILLGIATTRPVMGVFFATSVKTHLTPQQFFGFAFWIGFSINTIVIELWLRHTRRQFSL